MNVQARKTVNEVALIAAGVVLILNGHDYWAAAAAIGWFIIR